MRIRGAVLEEIGRPRPYAESRPLSVGELELGPPGDSELLVRIETAGLCHSDLSVVDGNRVRPLAMEAGFWRPQADGHIEVLLSHPTGISEIYLGEIDGAKIEMSTDVVARTDSAKEYTAGHRLYGLVEGDLMWAFDMAAMGQPLQPHLSARLKRAS